jgi:hypothetical protein
VATALPGLREATVRALLACATVSLSPKSRGHAASGQPPDPVDVGAGGAGRGGAGSRGHPLDAGASGGHLLQRPAHALRCVRAFVQICFATFCACMLSVADEELVSRGRREAGADQAPQVGQGAAVHDQVRRHLHPRRRRRARGGPAQRQEVNQPPNLHRRAVYCRCVRFS